MRLKIETNDVKFRVAASPKPKAESRSNPAQKRTPDGRPIWSVRLTAIETDRDTAETIWVEVAGDEPKLTLDEVVQVHGLVFAPWVNRENKIVRAFRADMITMLADARRAA